MLNFGEASTCQDESFVVFLRCLSRYTECSVSQPVIVTTSKPTDIFYSSWQPINVTWLSLNQKTPQQRAVAYAVYSELNPLVSCLKYCL